MDVKRLHTISGAADEAGVTRQSLWFAVENGRVKSYATADLDKPLRLVKLADVIKWRDTPSKVGRPRTKSAPPRKKRSK